MGRRQSRRMAPPASRGLDVRASNAHVPQEAADLRYAPLVSPEPTGALGQAHDKRRSLRGRDEGRRVRPGGPGHWAGADLVQPLTWAACGPLHPRRETLVALSEGRGSEGAGARPLGRGHARMSVLCGKGRLRPGDPHLKPLPACAAGAARTSHPPLGVEEAARALDAR